MATKEKKLKDSGNGNEEMKTIFTRVTSKDLQSTGS
jgi:hypothetical protein